MPTKHQKLGEFGEVKVTKECACPKCKRRGTLRQLPTNFKCADVICDFCGYLGQVKAAHTKNIDVIPRRVLGAAWKPQAERMKSAIYFPLFLVLAEQGWKRYAIYYLAADLQGPKLFKARNPLRKTAKRAGWRGFYYELRSVQSRFVRLA